MLHVYVAHRPAYLQTTNGRKVSAVDMVQNSKYSCDYIETEFW
jgi:hypothetical protein